MNANDIMLKILMGTATDAEVAALAANAPARLARPAGPIRRAPEVVNREPAAARRWNYLGSPQALRD